MVGKPFRPEDFDILEVLRTAKEQTTSMRCLLTSKKSRRDKLDITRNVGEFRKLCEYGNR
jgi:hypothetical protein